MKFLRIVVVIAAFSAFAWGQTTEITYQGQLQSSSTPASGNFDFEFALFDGGGTQIGPTLQRSGVAVAGGIFSVNLDFGSGFPGATRFLEIRVRQAGGGAFTTLSPRQPVTSAPYSIKSLTANTADNATNAANAVNAVNATTANTAGTATNFTGNLAGDVTGTQISTTVARLQSRTVAPTAPLDGQVLKFSSANNRWQPDTDNAGSGGGGGTITGVTPGTGLTGGGTTGNVTVGIGAGGVGTGQLAEGSVVDSKIVTVSGAKVIGQVTDAFNATNAATAANATQLGGVPANQYLQTNGNGSGLTNLNASSIATGTLANARLGQIPTANIADSAVTSAKIAGGQVVKNLNGLTDNVTLAAGSNISITPSGNTLTIASTGGGGVGGSGQAGILPLWTGATTLGNSAINQIGSRIAIGSASPSSRLQVTGAADTPIGVFGEGFSGSSGVIGTSATGTGVFGTSSPGTGVRGETLSGFGVRAFAGNQGSIALRTDGTSWFRGDTTPLSSALTGPGTGIAIGSSGDLGYISAFDYSAFLPRTLLLNNSGGNVGIGLNNPTSKLHVAGSSPTTSSILGVATGNSGIGVEGRSAVGTGVLGEGSGSSDGVTGQTTSGTGVVGFSSFGRGVEAEVIGQGSIALKTSGTSFFKGDTSPLSVANAGSGMGIAIGTSGTLGYVSAFDYGTNQTGTLLLNNGGGRVGINTNSPDQALTVNGNASKPGGGSWLAFSDERLKNIKGRFNGGLKAVMKLQPLRYEYKKNNAVGLKSDGEHIGFSAQEVGKIIPEAVTKTEQGYRLVNNDPIIWAMLNAIKEQQATIEKLSKQVRVLERANAAAKRIKRK
ncbi:MAG: tail fiber domain-containing protein [Pyrinomonadaceae bacterium]